jgi:hypothetical protein
MAQAVSYRNPTTETRVLSRVSPRGICGGQSGAETGFSPSAWVFSCQFHSTGAPLLGKGQKIIITDNPSRRYWCCKRAKNRRTKFCYHRIPDVTCRHAAKVSCIQCTDTSRVFKKSKFLQASRTSLRTQLLHWSQFCILRSNCLDFNC